MSVQVEEGYATYADALGRGVHVLHRPYLEGTEDYVWFSARPEREELLYHVDVSGVAGLRLVPGSNTLEFVTPSGDPRLRVAPPRGVDAKGRVIVARLEVDGCKVDTDPSPPWGRRPMPPGASHCAVSVRWSAGDYPVVIDPAWTTTGSLASARRQFVAVALTDRVVVAGGRQEFGPDLASAEVWQAGTWAATGSMSVSRFRAAACVASSNRLLVSGGYGPNGRLASVEMYDAVSGTWTAQPTMLEARAQHSMTQGGSDYVVAGGIDVSGAKLASTESLPISGTSWVAGPPLTEARSSHGVQGNLVVGGLGTSAYLSSAERLEGGQWTNAGSLNQARANFAMSPDVVPILIFGGTNTGSTPLDSVERFSGAFGSPWTVVDPLLEPRMGATAIYMNSDAYITPLRSHDPVAVAGGEGVSGLVDYAEIYGLDGTNLGRTSALAQPRTSHAAVPAPFGVQPPYRAMLIGGATSSGQVLASTELLVPVDVGGACQYDMDCVSMVCGCGACADARRPIGASCGCDDICQSGHCADGVCCDTACAGDCDACSTAAKGSGADGTCAPVADGLDPHDKCDALGSGVCQLPGTCDGTGNCTSTEGTTCQVAGCVTGSLCTSQGTCECQPAHANGEACSQDGECASTHCVGRVCCDSICDGECRSCIGNRTGGQSGQCGNVLAGELPEIAGACPTGTDPCGADGTCDGNGSCRDRKPAGEPCGRLCEAGSELVQACDDFGNCSTTSARSCAPYACIPGGTTCRTDCVTDADCSGGASCSAGGCVLPTSRCDGDATVVDADGKRTNCSPYACVGGTCRESCGLTEDCAPTYLCDLETSVCMRREQPPGEEEGGCGCRGVGDTSTPSPWWALGGLLLMSARRPTKSALARRRRRGNAAR